MRKRSSAGLGKFIFMVALVAVVGGFIFVSTWEMPAPTQKIEKVIPNDRFSR